MTFSMESICRTSCGFHLPTGVLVHIAAKQLISGNSIVENLDMTYCAYDKEVIEVMEATDDSSDPYDPYEGNLMASGVEFAKTVLEAI